MKQTINGVEYDINPKANLSEANLGGADLNGANLGLANLSGADLSGANLRWANLGGADLSGANLRWATIQAMQDGEKKEAVFALGDSVSVTAFSKVGGRLCFMLHDNKGLKLIICGCYINTLEAFEQRCKEKYPNDQKEAYSAQIQYLKQL